MAHRIIKSRARNSSTQLEACLRSVFILDLLAPGEVFYLLSPWIGNWTVLTTRFGEFRALIDDVGDTLWFRDFLSILAERGTSVRIVTKPEVTRNEEFLRLLSPLVEVRYDELLHEKGIVTNRYYLRGSMNMTFSGVKINEESVEITTDPEIVISALNEARATWDGLTQ